LVLTETHQFVAKKGVSIMGEDFVLQLRETTKKHEEWRNQCLNLIPSENITSPLVRKMLASDFGHRYYWDEPWYGGQQYSEQVEKTTIAAAKQLFHAEYVNVRPLSGHMSLMAVLMGLLEPGDTILISNIENGGYPLNLQLRFPMDVHYFPYQKDRFSMDIEKTVAMIERLQPRLAILGASLFPFPHPVEAVTRAAKKTGTIVVYDGSHVLGLIAGGQFQNPFQEGVEVLLGSTHKTVPGPQGGIILVNKNMEIAEKIDATLRSPPVLVDNFHMHRVAALGVTLAELLQFGKSYAEQIVQNSQVLAKALHNRSIPVIGSDKGFTKSHQVLLQIANDVEGQHIRDRLEHADIIVDAGVRLGTQEITRRGMEESEMEQVAELIEEVLIKKTPETQVKHKVHKLVNQFQDVKYCFEMD
jgi:glycine hydroxymethyltransferase